MQILIPKSSWVVLFLEDARFVANDDAIAVDLLPHVSRVAGAVDGDKQSTIAQPCTPS